MSAIKVAVMPGDGIGHEVMACCLPIIDQAMAAVGNSALDYVELEAGAHAYQRTGTAMSEETLAAAAAADAILLGAMGWPDIRYPDGTEIAPQLDLRFRLDLFAGVRPIRLLAGAPTPLGGEKARDIDMVMIRESTEGLFTSRGRGTVEDDRVARDTMEITREASENLFHFSFLTARERLAQRGHAKVTCVDKANVFRSFAFFRQVFDEVAEQYPDVTADHMYIDACALNLVRKPWDFDVLVTENMFGDILSDLGAGLVGGMGMAPSGDIGKDHAVFQPSHGTAPDIAGKGVANPTAMILSAAMMLEWLAVRKEAPALAQAGGLIRDAVAAVFAQRLAWPREFGGEAGSAAVADAIAGQLQSARAGAA